MAIETASPQDTFDHAIGAGGLSYSWWRKVRYVTPVADDWTVPDDWQVEVTCEDGNGGTATAIITHEVVLRAARALMADSQQDSHGDSVKLLAWQSTRREAANLVMRASETDFDAATSDELLQVIVLGKVVFS